MSATNPALTVGQAFAVLQQAGAVFSLPVARHVSVAEAAALLYFAPKWVKQHLEHFPNAWRAPGGELRIPVRDIEALAESYRIRRAA